MFVQIVGFVVVGSVLRVVQVVGSITGVEMFMITIGIGFPLFYVFVYVFSERFREVMWLTVQQVRAS